MGKRGPPAKPTPIRLLQGDQGHRPLNRSEPRPEPGRPPCPKWLSEEAKKEWRRVCPELERLGLLTLVDRAVLAGYCQSYARWQRAEEAIEKYGLIGKTATGYIQQLPYVSIANQALKQMRACAAEFGFSPASRTRITHPTLPKTEDDFEDFLAEGSR